MPVHDAFFWLWLVMLAAFVLAVMWSDHAIRGLRKSVIALLEENRRISDELRYGHGGVQSRPLILYHPRPSHWPYYTPPCERE